MQQVAAIKQECTYSSMYKLEGDVYCMFYYSMIPHRNALTILGFFKKKSLYPFLKLFISLNFHFLKKSEQLGRRILNG